MSYKTSKIFDVFGTLIEQQFIVNFYATRATLEQVFVAFARFQHDFSKVLNPQGKVDNGFNN